MPDFLSKLLGDLVEVCVQANKLLGQLLPRLLLLVPCLDLPEHRRSMIVLSKTEHIKSNGGLQRLHREPLSFAFKYLTRTFRVNTFQQVSPSRRPETNE